jgi:hypothetical protein
MAQSGRSVIRSSQEARPHHGGTGRSIRRQIVIVDARRAEHQPARVVVLASASPADNTTLPIIFIPLTRDAIDCDHANV